MGHTHAVFVLMVINKQAIRNVAAAFSDWHMILLNDSDALDRGCWLGPRSLAIYAHVDDFGIMGTVAAHCNAFALALRYELQSLGLLVKYRPCGQVDVHIGLSLSRAPAQWHPSAKRLAFLHVVLMFLSGASWVVPLSYRAWAVRVIGSPLATSVVGTSCLLSLYFD